MSDIFNNKDYGNGSMVNFKFDDEETKKDFEVKLKKLIQESEGVSFGSELNALRSSGEVFRKLSTIKNDGTLQALILEFISYIKNDLKLSGEEKIDLFYSEGFDGIDVDGYLYDVSGELSENKKGIGSVFYFAEEMDYRYNIKLEEDGSGLENGTRVNTNEIVFEEYDMHRNIKSENNWNNSDHLREVLDKQFKLSGIKSQIQDAMLSHRMSKTYRGEFENIIIPEISFMIVQEKYIDMPNSLKGRMLFRVEEDFQSISFWHHRKEEFSKEISIIKKTIVGNIGKIALKAIYSEK